MSLGDSHWRVTMETKGHSKASYGISGGQCGTGTGSSPKIFVFRQYHSTNTSYSFINPLKPELNSICYLLALLAHHFLHVSRIRVKSLTFRRLMSYVYMEHPFLMFLDHTRRRSTVGRTPLDE